MVFHQDSLHRSERFMNGGHLHQHVRAVTIFFHHFLDAADLAFNAAQPQLQILASATFAGHGPVGCFVGAGILFHHNRRPFGIH
jgi:hypothetical protein